VTANARARSGTAADQVEVDGQYVISGIVLPEGSNQTVDTYGGGFLPGTFTDYPAGTVLELSDGQTFVMHADGSYVWTSPEPFDIERGLSWTYVTRISPRFTLENYVEVLTGQGIAQAFDNTLTATVPTVILATSVAALAAYGFSWLNFRGRRVLSLLVVAMIVVPLQMSLIPVLRLYNDVGIGKNFPGIWVAHTGFGLPIAIFLIRNYMVGIPREVIECARMDGANDLQVFTKVVLPLSVPALAAYATFEFLWAWNDLLVSLVFLSQHPEQIVLTIRLRDLLGSRGENWEILTSAAFVSLAVPLLVFFALQRYFVRGLTAGSVKG
jgi:alpha-glucoside transport system permease protein